MQNILKILFSMVYGPGCKDDTVANQIYQLVLDYLQDEKQAQTCIYVKKKDRDELFNQLPKSQRDLANLKKGIFVKFMCQYGCGILIEKDQTESSINVNIECPQEYGAGSNSCKSFKLELCEPKSESSIYTPQLAQYQVSLQKFILNFNENLKLAIAQIRGEYMQKNQTEKYTPQQIEKAVKIAFNMGSHRNFYVVKEQNPQENKEQDKKNVRTISSENIQFADSNTNTAWYVTEAVIKKRIKDKKGPQQSKRKSAKLLIGFKSSILAKVIKQKKNSNQIKRQDIANFKKCLDQLIYSYKHSISTHTKKNKANEKFLEIIKDIQNLIVDVMGGKLTSKITDKYYIEDDIKIDMHGVAKINKPHKIRHQPQMIQMAKIQQFDYKIDSRLPFESLLDMYDNYTSTELWQTYTQQKKQQFLDHWVLLVEKTLFEIAYSIYKKDGKKEIIDLDIHMREIQCQIGANNLCKLSILYTEVVKKNAQHYGMGMKGQINSHIQLIKAICSVVAFQSVKMNRQRKKSNLNPYKIPLDIQKLYNNFISHDYLARRAMKSIYKYQSKRADKNQLFELNGKCNTFAAFGSLVGQQTRSAHVWLDCMQTIVEKQQQIIVQKIKQQQLEYRLSSLQSIKDSIKRGYPSYDSNSWKTAQKNCYIHEPIRKFSQKEKWLYAFIHNIPPDVLGLIKIAMLAQNPKKSQNENLFKNNLFDTYNQIQQLKDEQIPIRLLNDIPNVIKKYVSSGSNNMIELIGMTQPQNNIRLIYDNCSEAGEINQSLFQNYGQQLRVMIEGQQKLIQEQPINPNLIQFLKPPSDKNMKREHEVYANQHLKPNNIQIEEFMALCTTRAAQETQIVTLCQNILQRKIIPNCYDTGYSFKQQVFLQTAGQLSAYKFKTQQYFGTIRKLIKEFTNIMIFSDTNFCPVFGPFIGFLTRQLRDNGVEGEQFQQLKKTSLKIAKKCWQEFERGEKQFKQNPSLNIQWDQRFIVTAAICCFRQLELKQQNVQELLFLTKLIFQLRNCKIFSDRQQKPLNKRMFEKQRAYSIQKAIFSNIETISNFLIKNTKLLNDLMKNLDDGFPSQIDWERNQIYEITGKSQQNDDIYQIDLYRGCLFKNGKQLSALDPKIKQSHNFIKIFGKDMQFQVYPSIYPYYVRTKNNVNHQFKVNKEKHQVYFEFSEDGSKIRYILRKPHDVGEKVSQEIWQLLPSYEVEKSFAHLPALFVKNHIAWICEEKNCVLFRKIKYVELYDIGLIIHLNRHSEKQFEIQKAFHTVFHNGFQNQDLNQICDIQNNQFEEMIIRSKDSPLTSIKPYQYLSKIQLPEHILELKCQKTKQTHYLLYRYQLRFKLKDNHLISQSHYGYSIDSSYYDLKQCIFNQFPCLVLKKDEKNQNILNNHRRILIVSDGVVTKDGTITKSTKADAHIESYRYDIHDFFGDIRGTTRESQFHMASLMISIDNNMRISSIQMTSLQYAMYILKTCFTNRPLTSKQQEKLNNIINLANDQTLLLCQVLWQGSEKLRNILPFPKQQKKNSVLSGTIWKLQESLLQCRTLYEKKIKNQTISFRQKILSNMLKFIGFNIEQSSTMPCQKSDSQSSSDFQEICYWKGIDQYKGESILEEVGKIQQAYEKLCYSTKQLEFWNKDYPQIQRQNSKFPESICKNAVGDDKSLMMKQLISQLKVSYETFIKQENKVEKYLEQFSNEAKLKYVKIISKLISESNKCLKDIQQMIIQVKKENDGHPDIITGFRPTLSQSCYTRILCIENQIYNYYPKIMRKAAQKFKLALKIWMDLKTRVSSYERVKILLNIDKIDIVALLRQIQSPRKQIFKKTQWVCFETQMKIQIWPSQLQTYENLMKQSKIGPFCQLNMGQGKTQVIIPMIILNTIFNRKNTLPRINLLTSLYQQARGNMFKFLSVTGFQIPGFEVPFTRKVDLKLHNIYAFRDLINCFEGKVYILANRQSRLSEILRYNEEALMNPDSKISLQTHPLIKGKVIEIFDEIDAMMTPKKSYIFSIGKQIQLPSAIVRLEILKQCLEVFLFSTMKQLLHDKMATTDQTEEDAIRAMNKGQYPDGLRITFENADPNKIKQWKKGIAQIILKNPKRLEYSFVKRLNQEEFNNLVEYCINPSSNQKCLSTKIAQGSKDQIYILRGALACGIFEHCLSKRCGVDFGVPGPQHAKRIAVPYQAADIPSKTSEYEHPQVSALLSYIAYNMKGLTQTQFVSCLRALVLLTPTSKQHQYSKWIQILHQKDRAELVIDKANKINFNSKAHINRLYQLFRKNRKAIAFWLNKCIFPRDLKQYMRSICSSSFDLADVEESVGFSGTMDNHYILPNKIKFTPCQTPSIKGTDGKMIYLVTKFTNQICAIVQNQKPLWQRYIDLALEKKVGCLIDVGAICVGKSLKNQIVPWIAQHELFDNQKFTGISFCDQNGKWQVYDIEAKYYINRGTTIPDHQTFVVFDQARTRGADLKMSGDVIAALSLGPQLTKDKFMQAAGRLRKLGRNQSIIVMATHQVLSTLPTFPKQIKEIDEKMKQLQTKQLIQLVLAWCCHNTIHENQNLLLQYSTLGWKYVYSKVNKIPLNQQIFSGLKDKYEAALETRMVAQLSKIISNKKQKQQLNHPTGKHICEVLQKYGKNVPKQSGALDDVCQRQVQAQKQQQKQQQNGFNTLQAIPQIQIAQLVTQIKDTPYKFDKTFKMTNNFINTTKLINYPDVLPRSGTDNQLPQCYFVKYNTKQFVLISLREASLFIKDNIIQNNMTNDKISLLSKLSLKDQFIKANHLEGAYVSAKFIAGNQNYDLDQQEYLTQILLRSLRTKGKTEEDRKKLQESIVSIILKMRRVHHKKFSGSTLQKMITKLANQDLPDNHKEEMKEVFPNQIIA